MHSTRRVFIGIGLAVVFGLALAAAPSPTLAGGKLIGKWSVVATVSKGKATTIPTGTNIKVRVGKHKIWMMAISEGKKTRRIAGTWKRSGAGLVLSVRRGKKDVQAFELSGTSLRRVAPPKALAAKLGAYNSADSFTLARPGK